MGTWGPALFSDDTARDVRDEFRNLIGDGADGATATASLLHRWRSELQDPDVGPVFWLALAATQWKLGRLEDRVRQAALDVIDSGSDLARWEDDPNLVAKRRTVLAKLRNQLTSPPPAPKKVRKPFRNSCDWRIGEVIVYRMKAGTPVVLRTIDHHSDNGGVSPVCDVLHWDADRLPSQHDVAAMRPRRFAAPWDDGRAPAIILGATSAREIPDERLIRTGIMKQPGNAPQRRFVVLWRHVDEKLQELFGL
jgi:hypothetical protein